jgi:hypothetical protein
MREYSERNMKKTQEKFLEEVYDLVAEEYCVLEDYLWV